MNSSSCPSLSDLFSKHPSEDIEAHLAGCARCQALLSLREERLPLLAENEPRSALSLDRPGLAPGDVALVAAPDANELLPAVVLRETEDAVTIIPLSEETQMASEWDLYLPRDLLGYEVIAEAWNRGRVLPEQVSEVIAQLPEGLFRALAELLRASASGGQAPSDVEVGPAVLASTDPRLRFQDEEAERTHVFWEQTLALAGVASLGQLVAARREELGIEAEELSSLSLQQDWLQDLERDELDPSVLTRPVLVQLMRRLRVGASRRLGRLTYSSILAHRGGDTAAGLAFARNRQGVRGAVNEEDPEQFVDGFLKDLAEEK